MRRDAKGREGPPSNPRTTNILLLTPLLPAPHVHAAISALAQKAALTPHLLTGLQGDDAASVRWPGALLSAKVGVPGNHCAIRAARQEQSATTKGDEAEGLHLPYM